ncbi:MAG: DUF1573 domain-containing protein [Phaeodactylibacter sp.]|nr:DUF1573 domain-containing protein [Phaeodactylibacter sp.]MCB9276080.1 DUF1573 domain-containing protein [Lewinellaceae bacterium]
MKLIFPSIFFFALSLFAGAPHSRSDSKVEWLDAASYDFGDVQRNKAVTHDFHFRNISGQPIIVDNVRTTCGCTVPDWDKAAVAPDSTGVISVEYDARDTGYFLKKIKVYFHGQGRAEVLYIEGDVVGN